MNKILLFIVTLILSLSVLVSCSLVENLPFFPNENSGVNASDNNKSNKDDEITDGGKTDDNYNDESNENDNKEEENESGYLYNAFSPSERNLFTTLIGTVIPFVSNNEYYVEEYSHDWGDEYEEGLNFYTYGNTQAEFNSYRSLFSSYTYDGTDTDEYGDSWYYYTSSKGFYVDMSYYMDDEGDYVIDVFVYFLYESENGDSGDSGSQGGNTGNESGNTSPTYTYTDFTDEEKNTIRNFLGGLIPFIPNNEYYVEIITDDYGDDWLSFYTYGNTEDEFMNFFTSFEGYELLTEDSFEDEYGDMWYCLDNGEIYVMMSYYCYDGDYVVDLYAYPIYENGDSGDSGSQGGGNSGNTDGSYSYTDFTSKEKDLFNQYFGTVIPFAPNNEYYVEEYEYDRGDEYEEGLNFYTYGNTQAEFNSYRSLFNSYTYDGTDTDEYGDSWYYYTSSKGFYVDMSYYLGEEGDYIIDVYVYYLYESEDDNGGSGNGSSSLPSSVITNAGAGLPEGTDGVYNIDFTKAEKIKDVTDQGYYLDGCPTTGSPAVLVIPIEFSDVTAAKKGYSIEKIVQAFTGKNTDYYSVDEYYYISSYGKLDLDITVIDQWFRPQYDSSYYKNQTIDYYGDSIEIGDQLILDEALAYLATIMDLSDYDSDGNGIIDAVVMINTLSIDSNTNFNWAYRYWNIYTDDDGYYYEYDNVSANDYIWASYAFMHEKYDENSDVSYTDTSVLNTYTFIHEFGHILGADDYYDTEYGLDSTPLEGCDIMDAVAGDHNAYTKFNLGWITTSRLVTTNTSITLTLEDFSKNGDTIIIANNWSESLGAYQEYYIIVYYTMNGLNGNVGDNKYGYFARNGIIVYHVNASLYVEDYEGETYYDVYNNNTSYTGANGYGTKDNLIEFVKSAAGNFTYVENESLSTQTDDLGNTLGYSFTVNSLTDDTATITFTKN